MLAGVKLTLPVHTGGVQVYAPLSIISSCILKKKPIIMHLTDFYIFIVQFLSRKFFFNLTVSQHFSLVVKVGLKQVKTTLMVK